MQKESAAPENLGELAVAAAVCLQPPRAVLLAVLDRLAPFRLRKEALGEDEAYM
jgi:hypothetical protein